jgi:hypothetical protein
MFIIVSILLLVITVIIFAVILYRIRQPMPSPTSSPTSSPSVALFASAMRATATDDEYKIVNLSRASGEPWWNQEYSFSISRKYDYLYKLSGLPPPKYSPIPGLTVWTHTYTIGFNDFLINIYPDDKGNYEFLEPLPVSLIPYADMWVNINNVVMPTDGQIQTRGKLIPELENHPYPYTTLQGYYKQSPKPISITAPVDIKLRLYKYPQNSTVPIEEIKTFRVADGSIKALD